jgi:hypothetical protein
MKRLDKPMKKSETDVDMLKIEVGLYNVWNFLWGPDYGHNLMVLFQSLFNEVNTGGASAPEHSNLHAQINIAAGLR